MTDNDLTGKKTFFNKYRVNLFNILLFIVLPCIFFNDILVLNKVIFGAGDSISYYIPIRNLAIETIKNGEFPFWNSYIFGGFPLLAESSYSVFYPFVLFLDLIFPTFFSYNISILLHYSLAGIFMFFFLKETGLKNISSFTGGMIFIFSGMMITYRGFSVFFYTVIWLPLILLFLEKFRKTHKPKFMLLAALFYVFSFFGGFQQSFLYNSIIIFIYIIFFTFIYRDKSQKNRYYFLLSLSIFIIAIVIGLVQLLPTFELINNSFSRYETTYEFFTLSSFNPILLPILLFPYIFGCKHPSIVANIPSFLRWFGKGDSVEMMRYFGIMTIPLLVFSFFKKDKTKYIWIFILVASFFLVFGKYNPAYKVLYYIPILNKFKVPTRHWFEFGFAFSILCAYGLDYYIGERKITNNRKLKQIHIGVISGLLFIIAGFSVFYYFYKNSESFIILANNFLRLGLQDYSNLQKSIDIRNYCIYMPLIILTISLIYFALSSFNFIRKSNSLYIILIVLIFLDLFSMGHFDERNQQNMYTNDNLQKVSEISYIKSDDPVNENDNYFRTLTLANNYDVAVFMPDKNVFFRQEQVAGYDPLLLHQYANMFKIKDKTNYGWIHHTDFGQLINNNNILSIYNCKYIILNEKDYASIVINSDDYIIYKDQPTENLVTLVNKNYLPRFYFAEKIMPVRDQVEAVKILWNEIKGYTEFKIMQNAIIEDKNNIITEKEYYPEGAIIDILEYSNNYIRLNTFSEDSSFLVSSDTFYPGWHAYIDEEETFIYRTNGTLKGVFLPGGNHTVVFKFIPTNFWLFFAISAAGFTGLISSIIIFSFKEKKAFKKKLR